MELHRREYSEWNGYTADGGKQKRLIPSSSLPGRERSRLNNNIEITDVYVRGREACDESVQ